MNDQAVTDLLLQTGPIGTLVVVLGGLVRAWIREIGVKLDQLTKDRDDTRVEVRDLTRRVDRLERAGATTVREVSP